MAKASRTTEEYILLALSGGCSLTIVPFIFLRFTIGDTVLGLLDLVIVLSTASIFFYIWRTGNTKTAGRVLACAFIAFVFLTVLIKGATQTVWIYPALSATFFVLNAYIAAALCLVMLVAMGILIWPQLSTFEALQVYASVLATLVFSYAFADRMRYQQRQLEHLATRDPLTNAGNRRSMEQKLQEIASHQRRDKDCLASLILMDLDDFKILNDTHGHALGDEMLIELVRTLEQRIRSADSLFRFGGEEFVVIAEQTGLDDASKLAEQLRDAVASNPVLAKYGATISAGTAQFKHNESHYEWLGRADKAMYEAKQGGGNNCCIAA